MAATGAPAVLLQFANSVQSARIDAKNAAAARCSCLQTSDMRPGPSHARTGSLLQHTKLPAVFRRKQLSSKQGTAMQQGMIVGCRPPHRQRRGGTLQRALVQGRE